MNSTVIACRDAAQLGRSLRTWRALRRIKQHHAGELLGVSQATISRWENGALAPTPDEQVAIRELLHARLDSAADHELARMVNESARAVHLVCDLTHRLLALSPLRERQCSIPRNELVGRSLWRYASAEIVAAEASLADVGWFEQAPPAVEIHTGANTSTEVRIVKSHMRWVRFRLSDGSYARFVETLSIDPPDASADTLEQIGEAA
jgi:transcriptional regulator with XRE-family HTH domain